MILKKILSICSSRSKALPSANFMSKRTSSGLSLLMAFIPLSNTIGLANQGDIRKMISDHPCQAEAVLVFVIDDEGADHELQIYCKLMNF